MHALMVSFIECMSVKSSDTLLDYLGEQSEVDFCGMMQLKNNHLKETINFFVNDISWYLCSMVPVVLLLVFGNS